MFTAASIPGISNLSDERRATIEASLKKPHTLGQMDYELGRLTKDLLAGTPRADLAKDRLEIVAAEYAAHLACTSARGRYVDVMRKDGLELETVAVIGARNALLNAEAFRVRAEAARIIWNERAPNFDDGEVNGRI